MTILLTGSTGVIGSRVLKLLTEQRRDVICFKGDLRDPESYSYALKAIKLTACIHLAWIGIPDLEKHAWENLNASARFLAMLPMSCLTIGAGSCFEYGSAEGAVIENMAAPVTKFAKAKATLSASTDRWARIFYVYPNRLIRESLEYFGEYSARDPEHAIDLIHVDDVARGLIALLDADCPSGAYNIGSGQPRAVGSVVNAIARRFGKPEPYPGIVATSGFWSDQAKTFAATGWQAEVPFEP